MTPEKVLETCKKINKKHNYFNTILDELKPKKGPLAGIYISVKDNICTEGIETTAGSAILKGYKPIFDAEVVRRLKNAGATIVGKTSMDEFGFGTFNTNVGVGFPIPTNPHDDTRCTGGSSGGSAGITATAPFPHVSISESTGGSIEAPASFCGVIGFCPTYGRVSRNGLISYANSLDKIGPMAKTPQEIAQILEVISGHDLNDSTTAKIPTQKYTEWVNKNYEGKITIIKETLNGVEKPILDNFWKLIHTLEDNGITYQEISLPIISQAVPVYYILAMCEASTNLACFAGLRYGQESSMENKTYNEYFEEIRSKYFGKEAKRRIMLGTYARMAGYRDAYYIRAAKIRTLIIDEYQKIFKKNPAIISPTMPILPPKIKETEKITPLQNYMTDILTVGPNLAGIPHATIPIGKHQGLPIGAMVMTNHFEEGQLLSILSKIHELLPQ